MKLKEIKTKDEHYFTDEHNKKQGEYLNYYEEGKLWIKCYYKDGKRNSKYLSYHYNGQLRLKCFYKDGKRNGEYLRYYSNGKLDSKCYYKDDKIITKKEWLRVGDIKNKLEMILKK